MMKPNTGDSAPPAIGQDSSMIPSAGEFWRHLHQIFSPGRGDHPERKNTMTDRLEKKIHFIERSTERLKKAYQLPRDSGFWWFMRKETWIHLKRTLELAWHVYITNRGK